MAGGIRSYAIGCAVLLAASAVAIWMHQDKHHYAIYALFSGAIVMAASEGLDFWTMREWNRLTRARLKYGLPPDPDPNRGRHVSWQLVLIGGMSARRPEQSYYDWRRKLDRRLDPDQLAAWLLSTAGPSRQSSPTATALPVPRRIRYGQLAWAVLFALSAVLSYSQWRSIR